MREHHAARRVPPLGSSCLAALAILSLGQASAWMTPSLVSRQARPTPLPAAAAACRSAGRCTVAALRMGVEGSEAPRKGQTGGKSVVLGPGLFDPNIQVGPQDDDEEVEEILLARSQFKALFHKFDSDDDGKMNRDDLMAFAKELGHKWTLEQTVQAVWEVDTDGDGLMAVEELFNWYKEGKLSLMSKQKVSKEVLDVVKNVHSLSKESLENMFQQVVNENMVLEMKELTELLLAAGFDLPDVQVGDIFRKISGEVGVVSLDSLYAWYSSGLDLKGLQRRFSEVIVDKSDVDRRRIFVRGFPWRAKDDAVSRYFGKRCGEVEEVKMINWSRDGTPSGRSVVTFKDEEAVQNAMKLHRNKMGSRWLEVYRVNQGDREEVHNIQRSLHGALIGIKGAVVQEMQKESGALIFLETEPESRMVIKGRDSERSKAWALAKAIISDNEMQSYKVEQTLHGRLIGAKGSLKKMMELESGAHIVYRTEPEPCCQIFGNLAARERAWQLVSGKIWDLQHNSEEFFPLDKKFHGTLIGKGSVVVRALEERTGARIRFIAGQGVREMNVKGEASAQTEEAAKGKMVVRGTKTQCQQAWAYAQVENTFYMTILSVKEHIQGKHRHTHRSCCASCRAC